MSTETLVVAASVVWAHVSYSVEYQLTGEGEELAQRLQPVVEWAQAREN